MATKKFSTFEYASVSNISDSLPVACIRQDEFETPLGHAFVMVTNTNGQETGQMGIVFERIRYYLENEPNESSDVIIKNALIYTGGFLYQLQKKEPTLELGKISCLCVLYSHERIHYAWVGDIELFLFTGKKMYVLTCLDHQEAGAPLKVYLGHQSMIEPHSDEGAMAPVAGDKLIVASGPITKYLHTKEIKKTLRESMPLQTQAIRMIRQVEKSESCPSASALTMVAFHGINNTERLPVKAKPSIIKETSRSGEQDMHQKRKHDHEKQLFSWKNILFVAGILFVIYMLYDILNYGPRPISLSPTSPEVVADSLVQSPADTSQQYQESSAALPSDVIHHVQTGETWGRIYARYGVCSWFIINHPPNSGRFGSGGSLMAGERLRIPLKYSGNQELNPNYHQEFSTAVVGGRCENAGRELKDAFDAQFTN